MAMLHRRVPVTVAPADFERWIDCGRFDVDEAFDLLVPPREAAFAWHEVSTAVNRVANDAPQLVLPVDPDDAAAAAPPKRPARAPRQKVADDGGQGSLF
jgi:putative SOS response-associated peptidase YedK